MAVSGMAALLALSTVSRASSPDPSRVVPPSGVIGVREGMLSPEYWIERAPAPNTILMTHGQIEARNAATFASDQNVIDLARIPGHLKRTQVLDWMHALASPFKGAKVDASGRAIPARTLEAIRANADEAGVPAEQATRYGMAVRRALLKLQPSALRGYVSKDLTDFDAYAAGVLFPGSAVVILHRSRDDCWLLVQTWQGPGWVPARDIAEGSAKQVLGYARRAPYRVVTGDKVRTVFAPGAPALSELQLDMGVRVPLAALPPDRPVNGEGAYASWTLDLPTRAADGTLHFAPALLRKVRDSRPDYLPLTRADIIRQAFKFLGERYGWGHTFNARDCSGFTSDVYRSMGVVLPPNSGAQGASPAFHHQTFTATDSHEVRVKAVMSADIGDLLVVPGHVMMFLGKVEGQPYVIQDVPFVIYRDRTGTLHKTKVNQVSVTPLLPLLFDDTHSYVDAMTSLVHVSAP